MRKTFLVVFTVFLIACFTTGLSALVKVGDEVVEQFDTAHPYKGGKGLLMEKTYNWPNAGYISLHFSKFDLAPGDYVEVSSPDGSFIYTYNEKGKKVKDGTESISEFWASHIPGDTAIVRLYGKGKSAYGFEIDKWVHGYESDLLTSVLSDMEAAEDLDASVEAICSADDKEWAKCYEGTDMYNESRAVCRLLINGSGACTGWLLGSEGHVMTNNHCIGGQSDADNTDFEFMAEGDTCTTNCDGWFACPGTIEATSGTLIQTDSNLDFSLVLLPTNVTGTYGYMQLRNALPTVGERIYIPQHPGASGKQLAVYCDYTGGFCEVHSTNEDPCMGGPGDIGYYADTEGGSSGSPVLGYSDHMVVALHHCALCPNRGVPIPSIVIAMGGNLPADAIGSGTPPGPTPPAAPASLSISSRSLVNTLNWTDSSSNEDGFRIYKGTSSTNLTLLATVGAGTTTYRDSDGIVKRTYYYYKVCAYNAEGEGCSAVKSVKAK